jgi:nucleoside-diphosphate-sugar epimerase
MNAILGSNGFIGSALKRYADKFRDEEWVGINRQNYRDYINKEFDHLIWCAGTSSKRASREDLVKDHIHGLSMALLDFKYKNFVFISSQAIFEDSAKSCVADENLVVRPEKLSTYGWVKYVGEKIVRKTVPEWTIVRPNGFSGPGLTKNAIFDVATRAVSYLSPNSRIQYMHVDKFAEILVGHMLKKELTGIFHITAHDVISPKKIADILGIDWESISFPKGEDTPFVYANMDVTKIEQKLNILMPDSKEAVLNWNQPLY